MLEIQNKRIAISITSAYRTVLTTAVLVIAGIFPIKINVGERKNIYEKGQISTREAKEDAMTKWQAIWELCERWTKVFTKNVKKGQDIKWGEVNYFLTQASTGHELYGDYLHRKAENDRYCDDADTAKHTLFEIAK
ncbi:hypothetical protein JTB14_019324 [Gonioctena quinquepunctata]|nr:hypothetical protein JTB14_019324 [Gonioctena quinquepunctata]